jgi:hypothetical protein
MGCGCGKRTKRVGKALSKKVSKKIASGNAASAKLANRGTSIRKKRVSKIVSSPRKYR